MTVAIATPPATTTLPLPGGRGLALGRRPVVMAVINLTPDSFSDGGRHRSVDEAVAAALQAVEDGAEILDFGAESTRPGGGVYGAGAHEVPAEEELHRLLPVLERVRAATGVVLSVDTRKAAVASAAIATGADLVNDVSALGDPQMAGVVAAARVPVVLMHSRGDLGTMQAAPSFADPIAEVTAELAGARDRALAAGIAAESIILDPGIGFGKRLGDNLALIGSLDALRSLGCPILLGASRKSFIGTLTGAAPLERLPGSLAAVAWAAQLGAAVVRVHDVAATRAFLDVWTAIGDHRWT